MPVVTVSIEARNFFSQNTRDLFNTLTVAVQKAILVSDQQRELVQVQRQLEAYVLFPVSCFLPRGKTTGRTQQGPRRSAFLQLEFLFGRSCGGAGNPQASPVRGWVVLMPRPEGRPHSRNTPVRTTRSPRPDTVVKE